MLVDYALSTTATDLQLVLQQLNVKHPHLVAHSYAGRIAEQYYFQYQSDPNYSPKTMTLVATSFAGSIKGPGIVAIDQATDNNDHKGIANAFKQYAVTAQCDHHSLDHLSDFQQHVYHGALKTSLYAYQSYKRVAGLESSNFVPALVSLPNIPFHGPKIANSMGTLATISIPTYILGGSEDQIDGPVSKTQSPSVNLAILGTLFPNNFTEELRGVDHFAALTNSEVLANKITGFLKNTNEACSHSST